MPPTQTTQRVPNRSSKPAARGDPRGAVAIGGTGGTDDGNGGGGAIDCGAVPAGAPMAGAGVGSGVAIKGAAGGAAAAGGRGAGAATARVGGSCARRSSSPRRRVSRRRMARACRIATTSAAKAISRVASATSSNAKKKSSIAAPTAPTSVRDSTRGGDEQKPEHPLFVRADFLVFDKKLGETLQIAGLGCLGPAWPEGTAVDG